MSSSEGIKIMYINFLNELSKTIPEEESIANEIAEIEQMDAKKVCRLYIKSIPNDKLIEKRDPKFFLEPAPNSLPQKFNLDKYYSELSKNTKNAIWEHLSSINLLTIPMKFFSDDALEDMERTAKKITENFMKSQNASEDGNVEDSSLSNMEDFQQSMPSMETLMSSMEKMMKMMNKQR